MTDITGIGFFAQYGIPGLALFVLLAVIIIHTKFFAQMSKEWRETFSAQSDRFDERQKETNEVLRSLTKVISEK